MGPAVVVIGAGVVGAALVDELSQLGWTNVTAVDQGELPAPGGSTSHAPGLVFQANGSKALAEMARYTVEKFNSLTYQGEPCFLQVGGLEVATTPERVQELHRRHGWLTSWGIEAEVVDTDRCLELHPLLNGDLVKAGLHIPTDGLAKAVRAVGAQVEAAASRGVTVRDLTEVVGIEQADGKVTGVQVRPTMSPDAEPEVIPADIVITCAGIWGPKVCAMVDLPLALTPLAHQLAWTTDVPELAEQQEEAVRPILRHQDEDLYYRERFGGFGIGSYLHKPMPQSAEEIRAYDPSADMPSVLEFTEVDFKPAWDLSVELLPSLEGATVESGFNGLFSFTPDGMPLIGEHPGLQGFWVAEAVWVTHSAGVGKAVAELVHHGYSESFDVHEMELGRFEPHQKSPEYVLARDCRGFIEVYDILHPLEPPVDCRPLRMSPFYPRQQELGAYFLEASGWERPQWYEANAGLVEKYADRIPTPGDWAAMHWSPIVGAEALAVREGVGMFDMSALKHLEVTGRGAADFLNSLVTGDVAKSVGAVTYCLLLNEDGGIRSDITVTRLAADRFQVGANGNLDLEWLSAHLPDDGTVQVHDVTPGTCCIGLWGPKARDVVSSLTDIDVSATGLKYFRAKQGYIGTVPVAMLRLSYVGELGWEIYTTADQGLKLWDTLWEAGQPHGIIAGGRGAFSSMRLEKGYRSFGSDMTYEHDAYQAGLGFSVKKGKEDFLGFAGLAARRDSGKPRKVLACLTIDNAADVVMGKEPVLADGRAVGYVTSAGWGYTIGKGIAYAWVDETLAQPGTQLTISYFDRPVAAVVTQEPLFDPGMERLRG